MTRRKFTDDEVLEMRQLYYVQGLSFFRIGKMYNMGTATIRKCIFGLEAYRDIKDNIPEEVREKRAEKERKVYGIKA